MERGLDEDTRRALVEVGRALDDVADERDAHRHEMASLRAALQGYREAQIRAEGRTDAIEQSLCSTRAALQKDIDALSDALGDPDPIRRTVTSTRETALRWAAALGGVTLAVSLGAGLATIAFRLGWLG